MTTQDIIRRAGKNLSQAKGRTFLTSLAIAVGATTITLAMAAGAGGRDYVSRQMLDRGIGDARYIEIYSQGSESSSSQEEGSVPTFIDETVDREQTVVEEDSKPFTPDRIAQIKAINGIQDLRFNFDIRGLYVNRVEHSQRFVAPILVTQTSIHPQELTSGVFEDSLATGHIIISQDYLKAFGFDNADQAKGQKINLTYLNKDNQRTSLQLAIYGVYKDSRDSGNFLISYADAQTIFEHQNGPLEQQSFFQVVALVADDANVDQVVQDIQALGYYAMSNQQMQAAFLDAVNMVQWGLVGFGALALLASIFGIINTQYISVLERTQQIGLMRAVGASRKDIGRLFRYEAAWIGFLGALLGILVALACKLAEPLVKDLLDMPDDFTILIYEPLTLAAIVALLMIVAVVAGFFPSRRAAKLDPIEALRTE